MQGVDKVFKAQQLKSVSLRSSTYRDRQRKIKLLLKNFLEMEKEILTALSNDLGKSKTEALLAEIYGVKTEAKFAIKNIKRGERFSLNNIITNGIICNHRY